MTVEYIYQNLLKGQTREEQQLGKLSIVCMMGFGHIVVNKLKSDPDKHPGVTYEELFETISNIKVNSRIQPKITNSEEMKHKILAVVALLAHSNLLTYDVDNNLFLPTELGLMKAADLFVDLKPMKVSYMYEFAKGMNILGSEIQNN